MKMRNKLMVATVMLLVSALMMTSVSYAWFTISTAPEAKLQATTVVNENLEIALDNGGKIPLASTADDDGINTTWGNLVDLSAASLGELKPIKLDNGAPKYPIYANDGRISGFGDLTAGTTSAGVTPYVIEGQDGAANGTEAWAYAVDLWLRTNVAGSITLSTAADRGTAEGSGSTISVTPTDSALADDVKVAIGVGTFVAADTAPGSSSAFSITSFTELTNTNGALSGGPTITVAAADVNKYIPVRILIYLDGTNVSNADVAAAVEVAVNIQFTHNQIDDSMSPA